MLCPPNCPEKAIHRKYPGEYKLIILKEADKRNPLTLKVAKLEREVQRLQRKLRQAETFIEVQKMSEIQIPIQPEEGNA